MGCKLKGKLTATPTIRATLKSRPTIKATLTIPSSTGAIIYDGPYEWLPSEESQTVSISGKMATTDIIIEPIPSNYGRITYNGSTITVS